MRFDVTSYQCHLMLGILLALPVFGGFMHTLRRSHKFYCGEVGGPVHTKIAHVVGSQLDNRACPRGRTAL